MEKIIPAINSVKDFEKFLTTDYECCILMNLHVSILKNLVDKAHEKNKKCLIHLDLVKGLTSDEYGVDYAVQFFGVDGIVSTRESAIKAAKRKKVISIFRIFLIDTLSLNRSLDKVNQLKPDYLELLPAIAYSVMDRIKDKTNTPVIGGGLIDNSLDINNCINSGMQAVTISNKNLW